MKLFVGNLPYAATEADITDFFAQAGVTVDSVNVMRDRFSGEARGFGFVEIHDDAAANRAIEACNGRDLMARAGGETKRARWFRASGAAVVAAGGVKAAAVTKSAFSLQDFRNCVGVVRRC